MDYGVTITDGAVPWQIFQQEGGGATVTLSGAYCPARLSGEPPFRFEEVKAAMVRVMARIVREDTGESVIPWRKCALSDDRSWRVSLEGIPAGGLYRIETCMDFEGWDGMSVTRGDMVHHIGVGDIFVVAGQSNASGRGKTPVSDEPEPGVHLLRNRGDWDMASHPLNETTGSVYLSHFENHNPGHSPFLHFAKRLKKELGYPIGLVVCALGGSPLRGWVSAENGALFHNMVHILKSNGIRPKGILWYQGEADGFEKSGDTYLERFVRFVQGVREALSQPRLPFITVQLNRCVMASEESLDAHWGMVREAQRKAPERLESCYVVPSCDIGLYDFIHNAPEGNLVIGERCARTALAELYGKACRQRAPQAVRTSRLAPDKVSLELSSVVNWVNLYEVPPELLPFNAQDDEGVAAVKAYSQMDNRIILTLERPLKGKAVLHGAWRMNPGTVVPWDCMELPMLSFYGLEIEEEETLP